MPAFTFDEILLRGIRSGQVPARTSTAREWFRDVAKKTIIKPAKLMKEDTTRLTTSLEVGRLYAFYYDPKHKATLPYYDRFPLIFPFRKTPGGFIGINLHYLPYTLRAKLMDALYELSNNKNYDATTKLKLSYNILNSASKFKYFKPCMKQYLTNHVRSRFLRIDSAEWDIAIFLPVEQFSVSKQSVWKESRNAV